MCLSFKWTQTFRKHLFEAIAIDYSSQWHYEGGVWQMRLGDAHTVPSICFASVGFISRQGWCKNWPRRLVPFYELDGHCRAARLIASAIADLVRLWKTTLQIREYWCVRPVAACERGWIIQGSVSHWERNTHQSQLRMLSLALSSDPLNWQTTCSMQGVLSSSQANFPHMCACVCFFQSTLLKKMWRHLIWCNLQKHNNFETFPVLNYGRRHN